METIYYDYQGKIFSTEKTFQKDLNDTLNLNDPYGYLIPNRKAVIAALRKELSKLKPGQSAESLLRKWQNKYSDMNSNGEYQDYIGVIWWFIQRHIKKYN